MKRHPVFSLLGTLHKIIIFYLFNSAEICLFLAVLLSSVGKLCRLSFFMYIFQNSSKTILKQNMEQMEETKFY